MIKASRFLVIFLIGQNYALQGAYVDDRQYDDFDWKLTKVVNAKQNGNFVVSPFSVKMALAMIYPGTQGVAAKQIEDNLHINLTLKETVGQKFSSLMKSMETNNKSCELDIGTTVFVDNSFQINPNYNQQLQHDYNSTVQMVDFASNDITKAKMNNWCSKATKGKLQNMFNGDEFNADTAMILLNAIFFRGDWQFSFEENKTQSEMFYISSNKTSFVQMMSLRETSFDYYEMDAIQADFIRLPYVGDKFAMYILYPREVDGLEKLINRMTPEILSELVNNKAPQKMNLKMPKFKFDSSNELKQVLEMINITEIFDADLHLMGSSPKGPLVISNILQKSGIDVNENGSTAYAATYTEIQLLTISSDIDISITHPFMFLIVDEPQNNIIFIGKVIDPLWSSTSQEKFVEFPAENTNGGQQVRLMELFYIYVLILLKIFL